MKFKEVKELLSKHSFEHTHTDSCNGEIAELIFQQPNKKEYLTVGFHDIEYPEWLEDGVGFSVYDEWFLDLEISFVHLKQDLSISYISKGVLDIVGGDELNEIYLCGEDLYLIEHILDLIDDPYAKINFHREYNQKVNEFFDKIKKFFPVIEKYKLPHDVCKLNGDGTALYPSIGFICKGIVYNAKIHFEMDVLTYKTRIIINMDGGFIEEKDFHPIDMSVEEFERIVSEEMIIAEKTRQYQKEIKRKMCEV